MANFLKKGVKAVGKAAKKVAHGVRDVGRAVVKVAVTIVKTISKIVTTLGDVHSRVFHALGSFFRKIIPGKLGQLVGDVFDSMGDLGQFILRLLLTLFLYASALMTGSSVLRGMADLSVLSTVLSLGKLMEGLKGVQMYVLQAVLIALSVFFPLTMLLVSLVTLGGVFALKLLADKRANGYFDDLTLEQKLEVIKGWQGSSIIPPSSEDAFDTAVGDLEGAIEDSKEDVPVPDGEVPEKPRPIPPSYGGVGSEDNNPPPATHVDGGKDFGGSGVDEIQPPPAPGAGDDDAINGDGMDAVDPVDPDVSPVKPGYSGGGADDIVPPDVGGDAIPVAPGDTTPPLGEDKNVVGSDGNSSEEGTGETGGSGTGDTSVPPPSSADDAVSGAVDGALEDIGPAKNNTILYVVLAAVAGFLLLG